MKESTSTNNQGSAISKHTPFTSKYTRIIFFSLFIANMTLYYMVAEWSAPISFLIQAILVLRFSVSVKTELNYIEILLPFYMLFLVTVSVDKSDDTPAMRHSTWLRTH